MAETLFGSEMEKAAFFSHDRVYRYGLLRRWDDRPLVVWVMLNPSTADETIEDPTIRRTMGFSRDWGYGGVWIANAYALRSTDPKALRAHPDPVGRDNYLAISDAVVRDDSAFVVAAWGANYVPRTMVDFVRVVCDDVGKDLRCLGKTKDGHPRHPLYVKGDTALVPF